jgi:CHAT domain-containing protein
LVFNSRDVIPLVEPAVLEAETSKAGPTTGTSGLSEVSPADVAALDKGLSKEYTDSGIGGDVVQSTENPLDLIKRIQAESGVRSALVYLTLPPGDNRPLEVTLVTAKGAFRKRLTAPQWEILQQAAAFRSEVTNPLRTGTKSYMASARKLHRWIIDPLRGELTQQGVRNLVFLPQGGLRSIPFAALHDGNRFLVEEFGVGMMPSVSLTQTKYQDVKQAAVFAAGISEATQGQIGLPMVKGEIGAIAQLWPRSSTVLNEKTTLNRLEGARKDNPFRIVHLATHANFTAGNPKAAYIQLWDQRLQLEQLKKLNWNDPPVELLVLSACRTALGDRQAELGFAGIAVQSGVKSVVASLWYVSDTATTALSSEFYGQLSHANSKAEALRLAQVGLLRGKVKPVGDKITGLSQNLVVAIPEDASVSDVDFRHPYYWAAFTLVGNPW